jgi:predicted Na+-dependent transporter
MPTTLSTGVILTSQVGGNVAVALALVLLTNIAGVATIPYAIKYVFGEGAAQAAAAIRPELMIAPLRETILMPLLAGALVRFIVPGVRGLVDANRGVVRFLSSTLLIATPWMQARLAVPAPAHAPEHAHLGRSGRSQATSDAACICR